MWQFLLWRLAKVLGTHLHSPHFHTTSSSTPSTTVSGHQTPPKRRPPRDFAINPAKTMQPTCTYVYIHIYIYTYIYIYIYIYINSTCMHSMHSMHRTHKNRQDQWPGGLLRLCASACFETARALGMRQPWRTSNGDGYMEIGLLKRYQPKMNATEPLRRE